MPQSSQSTDPFDASWLKIERAKQHIADLHTRILAFQASDFYSVSVERDAETGDDVFKYIQTKNLPNDLTLFIGDAIHNLKSALDIAVNEVVFRRLGRYDNHTRFPFRETRDDLKAAIAGGLIHQASKAVSRFIVDTVKPYKGGNDPLWALHDLNILDKHRQLLPVLNIQAIHDLTFEDGRGQVLPVKTWAFNRNQQSIRPFPGHNNLKITYKGKPTVLIFFDNGLPVAGRAILQTLQQLTVVTADTLNGMAAAFLGEQ